MLVLSLFEHVTSNEQNHVCFEEKSVQLDTIAATNLSNFRSLVNLTTVNICFKRLQEIDGRHGVTL